MPTITVSQQVEATPATIAQALRAYAAKISGTRFPYEEGALIALTEDTERAYRAMPGMPALVLAAPKHTPMGFVAYWSEQAGSPQIVVVQANQVQGPFAT